MNLPRIHRILDSLTAKLGSTLRECLLGHTCLQLGRSSLTEMKSDVSVHAILGVKERLEPIPISELQQHWRQLPAFWVEAYQNRIVQLWQDTLTDLCGELLELHFAGERVFKELKKWTTTIDFDSTLKIQDQLREKIRRDFSFKKYRERLKITREAFGCPVPEDSHLAAILKHVELRNACQHRTRMVDDDLLQGLGLSKIVLLDQAGLPQELTKGDAVEFTFPELNELKRSILLVVQRWRS